MWPFKRKPKVEVKVGQVWEWNDENPWPSLVIKIIDIKNNWVRYQFLDENGYVMPLKHTKSVLDLRHFYRLVKESDS